MQRDITFKVWDYTIKSFIDDGREMTIRDLEGGFGDEVEYLQFTGIFDKNKKKIFDGDILKAKGFEDWFDEEGFYFSMVVKFESLPSGDSTLAGFLYVPTDCEVIGNIFQHPHLIKPCQK